MPTIAQFLEHTPTWVYVLFVYLVVRGLKALKPGETSLPKLALLPVILTVWGGYELIRLYGFALDAVLIWVLGLAVGIVAGALLVRNAAISVDPVTGTIRRPRDLTLLPLVVIVFAIKYTFAAIGTVSPALLMETNIKIADLGLSGIFTGIFVGKFAIYALRYMSAMKPVRA